MKNIQNLGIGSVFSWTYYIYFSYCFLGKYKVTPEILNQTITNNGIKSELFINNMSKEVVGKEFTNIFSFSSKITTALKATN